MPLVLMLKIHCCAVGSQRKAVSGVVESTTSLSCAPGSDDLPTKLKAVTTPSGPIELQLASPTRNFAGTVLPVLLTLLPSGLMGCRIACVGSPKMMQEVEYITVSVPFWNLIM